MKILSSVCGILLSTVVACQKPCPPEMECPQPERIILQCPPDMDEFARGDSIQGKAPCDGIFICRTGECLVCAFKPKPLVCDDGAPPIASNIPYDGSATPIKKYGAGVAKCQGGTCIFCRH